MLKGVTKSGFKYNISANRLNNYELLEVIGEVDTNPLVLSKVVNLMLGAEQANVLKEHLRTKEGFVPTDKLSDEIGEILQSRTETKNS